MKYKELRTPALAEDSEAVRSRVVAARNRQLERYRGEQKTYSNAQMLPKMLRKHCGITAEGEKFLENAITRLGLSARAHDRILKVARSIADLEATENIAPKHLSEAIQYRTPDRSYWARLDHGALCQLAWQAGILLPAFPAGGELISMKPDNIGNITV